MMYPLRLTFLQASLLALMRCRIGIRCRIGMRSLPLAVLLLVVFAGVPGFSQDAPFPGVQRILFEADVDTARAVYALESAGLGSGLSRDTVTVRLSVFGDVETVSLAEAQRRLDERDPRRDIYIQRLPRLFEAHARDDTGSIIGRYTVVYLFVSDSEAVVSGSGDGQGGDGQGGGDRPGMHSETALEAALSSQGISRERWVMLDRPPADPPLLSERAVELFNPVLPMLLAGIPALLVALLVWRVVRVLPIVRGVRFMRERAVQAALVLLIALVVMAGLLPVTGMPVHTDNHRQEVESSDCIELNSGSLALNELELEDDGSTAAESNRNVEIVAPEPSGLSTANLEAGAGEGNSTEAPAAEADALGALFEAAMTDFESGMRAHALPGEEALLPDFGLLIAHRAYQAGLAWGGSFAVPQPGDRLFRPRAEQPDSRRNWDDPEKSRDVVVEYSLEWFREQFSGDENRAARLLAVTAGRAPLTFGVTPRCGRDSEG